MFTIFATSDGLPRMRHNFITKISDSSSFYSNYYTNHFSLGT